MIVSCLSLVVTLTLAAPNNDFEGRFFAGSGDREYLELLDYSRRVFDADPQYQNMSMLYTPKWNGFVEGPTWGAWWVQNSYGTTYAALPIMQEPLVSFLQNAQDLWFDQMGDGQTARPFGGHNWVPPDGCLCDAASPGWFVAKQGDGRVAIHDWGFEFTAAGTLMQAELLLISRDRQAISKYLPKLRRCVDFIDTRRDPEKNLFLVGAAANLLAPSYAGCKKPDGSFDKAYLAGLSVTYVAAMDRLLELHKLAGQTAPIADLERRRDTARKGLAAYLTDEGYFVKSIDPDGTRHGVFGAEKHGYFEASPNHDAICFGVVDDQAARRIYDKIASIPELRKHGFVLANCPGLDDMYERPEGLWSYGYWVNGGHWSTCEGRMVMAYSRLGKHEDIRRSMRQLMKFARDFRMDNPLVDFGNAVYQPREPINLCYDTFAPGSAMVRGLFEYIYLADGLTLVPHLPAEITRLEQRFPIRFGNKRLYLSTVGQGPITKVLVNGRPWEQFKADSVFLPYEPLPGVAAVRLVLGGAESTEVPQPAEKISVPQIREDFWSSAWLEGLYKPATPVLPLRIGADSNGQSRFVGEIALARLYDRALTAAEVGALAADPLGERVPAGVVGQTRFQAVATSDGRHLAHALPISSHGQAVLAPGEKGTAVQLTGEGYVEVGPDPKYALAGSLTLEAYLKPGKLPQGGGRIIDRCTAGAADGYTLDTFPDNALRLITPHGDVSAAKALPPGQWAHVVATAEPGKHLRLFVNGKEVAVRELAAPKPGSQQLMGPDDLRKAVQRARGYLEKAGDAKAREYGPAHARLFIESVAAMDLRRGLKLPPLEPRSQAAADRAYLETAQRLWEGLQPLLNAAAPGSSAPAAVQ